MGVDDVVWSLMILFPTNPPEVLSSADEARKTSTGSSLMSSTSPRQTLRCTDRYRRDPPPLPEWLGEHRLKSVATRRPTTVNCLKRWGVFEKNGQERLIQWRQNCHPPGRAPPRPRGRGFPCVKWDATERDPQLTLTHPVGASSTSGRVLVTAQDSLQGPTSTQFRRVSPGIFFKERPKRKSFHHTFIFRWIAPFQQHQVS